MTIECSQSVHSIVFPFAVQVLSECAVISQAELQPLLRSLLPSSRYLHRFRNERSPLQSGLHCSLLLPEPDTEQRSVCRPLLLRIPAHEKEILMAQIQNDPKMAGKPEKVIEGAVNGRLNKELKEVCLLEQVYVKAEDCKQ